MSSPGAATATVSRLFFLGVDIPEPTARPRVVIVGAGLAGTATAIRILRLAREPLEVVLVERRADFRCGGPAYHRDGNPWEYVFNIQAGRMSMFREDVDDFITWANCQADRGTWSADWKDVEFSEHGPAPRRIYQQYLEDRLAEARREACPGVGLTETAGEVTDLAPDGGRVAVTIDAGRVVPADQVVLATGLEIRTPAFARSVLDHPAFVREPYSRAGIERLERTPPGATVLVVGSVLSAYDTAALLLRRGHTGKVYLVSRSGTTLRTYPEDHRHDVIELPAPDLAWDDEAGVERFVEQVRTAWDDACAALLTQRPDIDRTVVPERVIKAWEPYVAPVLDRLPTPVLRGLLDDYATPLATLRVGALAYTTRIVEKAMVSATKRVELVVGRVLEVSEQPGGRLAVAVSDGPDRRTVLADLVVSNFGREPDYSRVTAPLWTNLLARGTAAVHRRTGRGVEVSGTGALLGPGGLPTLPVYAVGVLREGDEIVRNGRTGAFTFNLAAIKNHSIGVAAEVVMNVEARYRTRVPDGGTAWAGGHERLLDRATALEVRRMAERDRAAREELAAATDELVDRLADLRPAPGGDREDAVTGVRRQVTAAAVRRMSDLSVTPRRLRELLDIGGPAD